MKRFLLALIAIVMGATALMAQNQGYPTPRENMAGKWGYVNATGQMVIRPRYDTAMPFKEGYAAVEQSGKWGFINLQGKLICKVQYQIVHDFHQGYAVVKYKGKWGAIDKTGQQVVPCKFDKEGDLANIRQIIITNQKGEQMGTITEKNE